MSERLRMFPASLFERILLDRLPPMQARWAGLAAPGAAGRPGGPGPLPGHPGAGWLDPGRAAAQGGLLRAGKGPVLAGRMAGLVEIVSRVPRQLWYEPDSQAHDQRCWERALTGLARGTLVLVDLGFTNYGAFDQLTDGLIWFITRAKQNLAFRVERVLTNTADRRDRLVWVGTGEQRGRSLLRLVEIEHQGRWYRSLTNVLDPQVLATTDVAALYWQRRRIEDAFNTVKRLLGLAYFWVGSVNGVQWQVWATWLRYTMLVDLTDAVAERLRQPFQALSVEMVYRGLHHFTQAHQRGEAEEPVSYALAGAGGVACPGPSAGEAEEPVSYLAAKAQEVAPH
jgi:hypothetical protein